MCLSNLSKKKIAKEDITAFKVLSIYPINPDIYFAPIASFRYNLKERYETKIDIKEYKSLLGTKKGFHSFNNYESACEFRNRLQEVYNLQTPVITTCTIPKGTVYYEGCMFDDGQIDSYTSECIIIENVYETH